MFFKELPNRELVELHEYVVNMANDERLSADQRRNLVSLLETIEEELCKRCSAADPELCLISGTAPKQCPLNRS